MIDRPPTAPVPLEIWGGLECTVNRVRDRWFDQVARSGHDERPDDLERFAALGLSALRYPVLWERLAPDGLDRIAWKATDERMALLRRLGLRPIVGLLHHGSGPSYTSLLDPDFPEQLARFARAIAARYPWVTDYTPVNEPLTTARFSALYGHWFPHERSDRAFIRAFLAEMRAIVLAMRAIREVIPRARLIQTEDCGTTFGTSATARQTAFEGHRKWLTWDLLTGRVDTGHPLWHYLLRSGASPRELAFFQASLCAPDIVGLNYYVTSDRFLDERLERYPACTHGGNGEIAYADLEAVRARTEGVAGHEAHLLAAWQRYGLPVAITEVHLACTREEQLRWLVESWRAACDARRRGADVRAVTAWALLGSSDWNSLVTCDAGEYEPGVFDVRAPTPRATALADAVKALAAGESPTHPVLSAPGWWRRQERLSYAAIGPPPTPIAAAPILVIGATGTLGRAFQRICTARGVPSRLVGRHEVDVTDPAQVDAIVRRLDPWAVVNATGYVRVDEAEGDADCCRRLNVAGPVNLAAACRRRGLPLVTFSSDLVFDGRTARAYREDDAPNPLNVYGSTKAESERRVLDLLPSALVVRTSAFFGPWDEHNFLASLFRALDAGDVFVAAADSTVSPTYVPHLVHASLDLLIDGERGIWHLANDGAVTWFEFARAAAAQANRPLDAIRAAPTGEVWAPAARPAFSALTSGRGWIMPPLDKALAAFIESRAANAGAERCLTS